MAATMARPRFVISSWILGSSIFSINDRALVVT